MAVPWPWLVPLVLATQDPAPAADKPAPRTIPEVRRQKLPAARRPAPAAPDLRPLPPLEPGLPDGFNPDQFYAQVNDRFIIIEARPNDVADEGGPRPAGRAIPQLDTREMMLASINFDRVVFGDAGNPANRRGWLGDTLINRILAADRRHPLTDDQRRLLHLAGAGDIHRYFDRVEAARRDFEAERLDYDRGVAALDRLEPLARDLRLGPFGPDSLFAKTLGRIGQGRDQARPDPPARG